MNIFLNEGRKNFLQYINNTRESYNSLKDSEFKNKLIKDLDNLEEEYSSCLIRYLDAELNFVKGKSSSSKLEEISKEMMNSFVGFVKNFFSDVRVQAKLIRKEKEKDFWKYRKN